MLNPWRLIMWDGLDNSVKTHKGPLLYTDWRHIHDGADASLIRGEVEVLRCRASTSTTRWTSSYTVPAEHTAKPEDQYLLLPFLDIII